MVFFRFGSWDVRFSRTFTGYFIGLEAGMCDLVVNLRGVL